VSFTYFPTTLVPSLLPGAAAMPAVAMLEYDAAECVHAVFRGISQVPPFYY
jgi:hypothetical protein